MALEGSLLAEAAWAGSLAAATRLRGPFDSLAHAHLVRSPTLVVLAERDRRVPHGESLKLVDALRKQVRGRDRPACEVVTVSGTTHRSLPRDARTLARMAAFAQGPGLPDASPNAERARNSLG